jgi:nitrogen-specific signal transduction histidine kinase/CheY-like chemotaxis protein
LTSLDPQLVASLRSRIEELSSRLRHTEEQLAQAQKMEVIGRLTGGIAHDFNNLLTGILGYASLLKTVIPEDGEGYGAAAYIERSARRASELTRQLLAYSRRESPKFRPVDIHRVIGEAIEILSRSVNKNVELRTDFAAPPGTVLGDPGTLVQALLNLGVNANDAMPSGGLLAFSTGSFQSDGNVYFNDVLVPEGSYVSVLVSDTGCGIPETIRLQVFAPFFTTKAPGEGTGLGLPMVYSCVRSHGGFLRMESRERVGTTFQILLPAAEESDRLEEPSLAVAGAPTGKETVLVIDDEDIPLHLLCDLLRSLGYTPLSAPSGDEGIEIFRSAPEKVDLVILDKIMPGMDGIETMRRLREIRPGLRSILCSGYTAEGTAAGRASHEFDDYLQKPYERGTLARKVRSILDSKPSRI